MTHVLSVQQFKDAIAKGLGRAYLHVRRHGDAEVHEVILQAAINNLAYDRQCEDDRSAYVHEILKATGHPEEYILEIIRAAKKRTKWAAKEYAFKMIGAFAREGNEAAKVAIRHEYAKWNPSRDEYLPLLDADGMEGFLAAAGVLGKHLAASKAWIAAHFLAQAENRFGRKRTERAVHKRDSDTRRFHRLALKARKRFSTHKPKAVPTWRQMYLAIQREKMKRIEAMRFGWRASLSDVESLYERMLEEKRDELIWQYLQCFCHVALPRLDKRLFVWARSRNPNLHRFANLVLSKVKAKAVRDFAFERLAGGRKPDWAALQLLELNYKKGDGEWLLPLLPATDTPAQQRHSIGMDIRSVSSANRRDVSLKNCLRWAYENTPCSLCRGDVIKQLVRLNGETLQLLREAQFDADSDVRTVAEKTLKRCKKSGSSRKP